MRNFKTGYVDLTKAIEAERSRIRAIKDRGTYGTEYLHIITPDFVAKYKSHALIKLSRDLTLDHSSEASRAKTFVDAELIIRKEQTLWQSILQYAGLIVGILGVAVTYWVSS